MREATGFEALERHSIHHTHIDAWLVEQMRLGLDENSESTKEGSVSRFHLIVCEITRSGRVGLSVRFTRRTDCSFELLSVSLDGINDLSGEVHDRVVELGSHKIKRLEQFQLLAQYLQGVKESVPDRVVYAGMQTVEQYQLFDRLVNTMQTHLLKDVQDGKVFGHLLFVIHVLIDAIQDWSCSIDSGLEASCHYKPADPFDRLALLEKLLTFLVTHLVS